MSPSKLIMCATLNLLFTMPLLAQDCTVFNKSFLPPSQATSGTAGHVSGSHNGGSSFTSSCTYSGAASSGACSILCQAYYNSPIDKDTGVTTLAHAINFAGANGVSTSNGPAISCGAQVAVGVVSCVSAAFCNMSVTLSVPGTGIGGSVGFSSSPLWTGTYPYSNTCGAETAPICQPTSPAPYLPPNVGAAYVGGWHSTAMAMGRSTVLGNYLVTSQSSRLQTV